MRELSPARKQWDQLYKTTYLCNETKLVNHCIYASLFKRKECKLLDFLGVWSLLPLECSWTGSTTEDLDAQTKPKPNCCLIGYIFPAETKFRLDVCFSNLEFLVLHRWDWGCAQWRCEMLPQPLQSQNTIYWQGWAILQLIFIANKGEILELVHKPRTPCKLRINGSVASKEERKKGAGEAKPSRRDLEHGEVVIPGSSEENEETKQVAS